MPSEPTTVAEEGEVLRFWQEPAVQAPQPQDTCPGCNAREDAAWHGGFDCGKRLLYIYLGLLVDGRFTHRRGAAEVVNWSDLSDDLQ